MFYVASVITFRVLLELLWKTILNIRYKLNRFWPPWVELFWYSCTVVQRIRQVHTVILNVLIWLVETFLQAVHQYQSYIWHCFCCVIDYYCSLLKYTLRIIIIAFHHYVCFYYLLSVQKNTIFPTPRYWIEYMNVL